ncbi:MAG TPA: glycosyl hydrolase 115 family protein [Puia sp.]|nr:glycosyl hydrolase 115 family protein [Puia sp.]
MQRLFLSLLIALRTVAALSQDMISDRFGAGDFPIVSKGSGVVAVYIDPKDHWLIGAVARSLQDDIQRVTGFTPVLITDLSNAPYIPNLIIIGSLDQSVLIQRLARRNMIPDLSGKWESYVLKTVSRPIAGIERALIIAGSDRRGTAYGVFELSRQMGVSPWYWWADVPVRHKDALFFNGSKSFQSGPPAVKYRGFFINDEAPALSGWVHEKYGGFNHLFYEKVFELLLRLKANYLWPAMWGSAFNADDPQNPILASEYGIVMGTSHHEPMLRAQQEWKRFGSGAWDYQTNAAVLDSFWRKGIGSMDHHESIVTVGMRGDGDKPMEEHSNIALLEKIVADQRSIIAKVTGKDPSATPQSWALYKEVQEYYDKGMRVPDDVTLLLCDDNWGNVRKLPRPSDPTRGGGYGMYYHFDYVGGPRNYKWLNTNPISRVWEEMHLTKAYGDDRIWIVNVGDIKPMEFPISFFFDYAWDPNRWPASKLPDFARQWAAEQFGLQFADSIAYILTQYTKYNGRRKPELLSPDTYSLLNYQEADKVVSDYNQLAIQAESISRELPKETRDAFFELVLYPVLACANLNELYVTAALNKLYAAQGRAATNALARRVRDLFDKDSLLAVQYNQKLAGGKWNHMMDQTHIGYNNWQEPRYNNMPAVISLDPEAVNGTPWGVAVEGSASWWPSLSDTANAILPPFYPYHQDSCYFDVFMRGNSHFAFTTAAEFPWVKVAKADNGQMEKELRFWVSIDWAHAPFGKHQAVVAIIGPDKVPVNVTVRIDNPAELRPGQFKGFIETNGCISMEAEHYSHAIENKSTQWRTIPNLGRTLSGVQASPVTAPAQTPGSDNPRLEYELYLFDTGIVKVDAYFSPILAFNRRPIRYAVSFDDETPVLVDLSTGNEAPGTWDKMVADNIRISVSAHHISRPGIHILKYWLVDPCPVLQKIVVDCGGVRPSYLGPPESATGN